MIEIDGKEQTCCWATIQRNVPAAINAYLFVANFSGCTRLRDSLLARLSAHTIDVHDGRLEPKLTNTDRDLRHIVRRST